jgi:CheY-like chemotaxis protein
LINNAIKFTNKGTIEFGYNIKKSKHKTKINPKYNNDAIESNEPYELEFYVKDTGIGIPAIKHKTIFERFMQVDVSNTRQFEGSGLGLSIAKAYVEMLGGSIWVESEENNGSVFYFTIPYILESKLKKQVKNYSPVNGLETQIRNLKILIAEDDEISEKLISVVVKNFSKEVYKAKTGTEVVEICKNNEDIDLIIMDIKMPEMDGYEATRLIRKFNTKIVIIAQTAFAFSGDKEKAIEAGCNDYIAKPFSIAKFTSLIKKYF